MKAAPGREALLGKQDLRAPPDRRGLRARLSTSPAIRTAMVLRTGSKRWQDAITRIQTTVPRMKTATAFPMCWQVRRAPSGQPGRRGARGPMGRRVGRAIWVHAAKRVPPALRGLQALRERSGLPERQVLRVLEEKKGIKGTKAIRERPDLWDRPAQGVLPVPPVRRAKGAPKVPRVRWGHGAAGH